VRQCRSWQLWRKSLYWTFSVNTSRSQWRGWSLY